MAITTGVGVGSIDATFTAPIRKGEEPGAWTVIVLPASSEVFGTRRPVKVGGTIDDTAFEATLLPMGNGDHMLPVKAALRVELSKSDGDDVTVHLTQRFG